MIPPPPNYQSNCHNYTILDHITTITYTLIIPCLPCTLPPSSRIPPDFKHYFIPHHYSKSNPPYTIFNATYPIFDTSPPVLLCIILYIKLNMLLKTHLFPQLAYKTKP